MDLSIRLNMITGAFTASVAAARSTLNNLTDSVSAYRSVARSVSDVKLAGTETLTSLQTTLATAKAELSKFSKNKDVQVAVEIGKEFLDESWIKARQHLQELAKAGKAQLDVGVGLATDKAKDVGKWIGEQKAKLTTPLSATLQLVHANFDSGLAGAKSKLESLQQYKAARVLLSAINGVTPVVHSAMESLRILAATPIRTQIEIIHQQFDAGVADVKAKLASLQQYRAVRIAIAAANMVPPVASAAMATLAPLRHLAGAGISVAFHLTEAGVATAVAGIRASLNGLVGAARSAASSIGEAFSGLGRILTSSLGLLGISASVGGLAYFVKSSMESVGATARLSDRLGITTQAMGGLQYAAKLVAIDSEELNIGLEKMLRNLSEAVTKGGPAAEALKRIKLDPKALAAGAPEEALKQIADGLKGITNPAERAQTAVDIFGKAGQRLLPLLMQGSEGIKAAQVEAEKLGLTFNRVDAAKVELANQAMIRMQSVMTAVGQQLAIGIAPYVEAIGKKFTNMATQGGGAASIVSAGMNKVTMAVAHGADVLDILKSGWDGLRAAASYVLGGIVAGVGEVIKAFTRMVDAELSAVTSVLSIGAKLDPTGLTSQALDAAKEASKQMHDIGQGTVDFGKNLFTTGGEAWDKSKQEFNDAADGKHSKAAKQWMDDAQHQSATDATAQAAEAGKLNTGGAIPDEDTNPHTEAEGAAKAFEDAARAKQKVVDLRGELASLKAGVDPEAAKLVEKNPEAAKLQEQIDLIKKRDEMLDKDPMVKFKKTLDDINKMLSAGLITMPEYDQLTSKASKQYDQDSKKEGKAESKQIDVKAEQRRTVLLVQQGKPHTDAATKQLDAAKMQIDAAKMQAAKASGGKMQSAESRTATAKVMMPYPTSPASPTAPASPDVYGDWAKRKNFQSHTGSVGTAIANWWTKTLGPGRPKTAPDTALASAAKPGRDTTASAKPYKESPTKPGVASANPIPIPKAQPTDSQQVVMELRNLGRDLKDIWRVVTNITGTNSGQSVNIDDMA